MDKNDQNIRESYNPKWHKAQQGDRQTDQDRRAKITDAGFITWGGELAFSQFHIGEVSKMLPRLYQITCPKQNKHSRGDYAWEVVEVPGT